MTIELGKFRATHIHNEGDKYEVLDYPRVKIEGHWFNGVLYRNSNNVLCVRTKDNFDARFSRLPSEEAVRAAREIAP